MNDGSSNQDQRNTPDGVDTRWTMQLFADVRTVLEAHGYRMPQDTELREQAYAHSISTLARLVAVFEGQAATDVSPRACPTEDIVMQLPQPADSREAHQAAIAARIHQLVERYNRDRRSLRALNWLQANS